MAAYAEHEKQVALARVQQKMEQMRADHAAAAEQWTQRLADLTGTSHLRFSRACALLLSTLRQQFAALRPVLYNATWHWPQK